MLLKIIARSFFYALFVSTILAPLSAADVDVAIVWDANARDSGKIDQESYFSILTALGFKPRQVENPSKSQLLIVPFFAANNLTKKQIKQIIKWVEQGMGLITDGHSPLSSSLGLEPGNDLSIKRIKCDSDKNLSFNWADGPMVRPFKSIPENFSSECREDQSSQPILISGTIKKGKVIAFADLFDGISSQGYSRFPDFPLVLIEKMNLPGRVRNQNLEVYFDPPLHEGMRPDELAKFWAESGIGIIYVSAWYEDAGYDYAKLISAAHDNRIKVYPWLEWPHISEKFWKEHPQWREKTFTRDGHVDWRLLMNLQNTSCRKQVLSDLQKFLTKYDWDGLNVAEIYFEPVDGPKNSDSFTPLNKDARAMFKKKSGIDPIEIFLPSSRFYWKKDFQALNLFYQFRKDQTSEILNETLKTVRETPGFGLGAKKEVVVTLIDVLNKPDMGNYLGIDLNSQMAVAKQYGATLQIEDPCSEWAKNPRRYLELNENFHQILKGEQYGVDINIVPVHSVDDREFPTARPVGSELLQLWRNASAGGSRVCFYAESELRPQDWQILTYANGKINETK